MDDGGVLGAMGVAGRSELVRIGDVEFYMELADAGGAQPVAAVQALSFDGIRDTVQAVGEQLTKAWQEVKPTEATVEFGISATAKTGRLTGLIVDGAAEAALKVTLTWRAEQIHKAE